MGPVRDLPNHMWYIDGVGRRPFTITSHIGESSEICILISQSGALTWLEQPDLIYTFSQPHRLQQDQRTPIRWNVILKIYTYYKITGF